MPNPNLPPGPTPNQPPLPPGLQGGVLLNPNAGIGPANPNGRGLQQPGHLLDADQIAYFGLDGPIATPASRDDELETGIAQMQAAHGTDYTPFAPDDPTQMSRRGASRIDAFLGHTGTPGTRPAALPAARRNAAHLNDMTTGRHRNEALTPREAPNSLRARTKVRFFGSFLPGVDVPSHWLAKRVQGNPTGPMDTALDATLGRRGYQEAAPGRMQAFRTVTPRPLRALYRAPGEIARDRSLSRTERVVGAAAVGLAGVVLSPVTGAILAIRGTARGLRQAR